MNAKNGTQMNAEKTDQGRSCKPFKFDLALSVLSAFICVLFFCAVCPAQIHPHSFSPRQLGIMQAWYRADIITALADGDPVASWVDSTANARTLAQSTADYRPAYKVSIQNGRPAIRFDGGDDQLVGASAALPLFTIFSVQRPDAIGEGEYPGIYVIRPGANGGSYNVWGSWHDIGHPSSGFHSADWAEYWMAHTTSLVTPESWSLKFDGNFQGWINGVKWPVGSGGSIFPGGGTTLTAGSWNGFRYLDGDIFELAFFNVALSDRDRQRVERYLLRKWGL